MKFTFQLLKIFLFYCIVLCLLVLVVMFPRTPEVHEEGRAMTPKISYSFSWQAYKDNLVHYISNIWNEKSLGPTLNNNRLVEDELGKFFPNSIKMIIPAFFFSLFLGIWKGIFDYRHRKDRLNILGNGFTWLFQSIPDFFLIICVQWIILIVFSMPLYTFDEGRWFGFILPALLISITPMMYIARITFSALANEEGNYYIQVAKAKGFQDKRIVYRHILKNSLQSILPHTGNVMLLVITSMIMVENLSAYDGIGSRLFEALGFDTVVNVNAFNYFEGEMIIGIGICILLLIMFAQITGAIIKKCLRLP
ncbi:ABC transporter permease [Bacillaceae bacterium Marseille-Q3522]|nr:ABC transporter permease [Bacillaceae bacterium Marseille-Q3522]